MGGVLKTYQSALDYLFARTTGKNKLGLGRVEALLETLGNPHRRLTCFHVAGTNGKGSVCATIEALLRFRGRRVGKYTSPHLVDFRERFLVNGEPIDERFVIDFVTDHVRKVEDIGATFFEATTAMAFEWFVRQRVDVAVIETGLGGRLDATNVVHPLVAGVASIGIDHVEYLGDTREEIAREKAGIFKPGAAAVIGEPDADVALLLADLARHSGATKILDVWRDDPPSEIRVDATGTSFTLERAGTRTAFRTPLAGEHQASNAAMALAMMQLAGGETSLTTEETRLALQSVSLPGRFHRVGSFIFDVAHNGDGAIVLDRTLRALAVPRPLVCVLCVLDDKDWRGMMRALAPSVDAFILVDAPSAPPSRAWDVAAVASYARENAFRARVVSDFDQALREAQDAGGTVLVTGSFHTVGDAMSRLQVDPLAR
ncbi:MAG: Dihydrofolate synthase/folylpolyglutamate synthase [Gemmatimonadaceae bacterium]|nr:Dihydrofolate synthase/folylpolyglutamate synthase [Gemmatimonadaceae bacterium]